MQAAVAPKRDETLQKAVSAKRESISVEFKEKFDIRSKQDWCEILKDLTALANSGGGVILFGVNNVGDVTGTDVTEIANLDPAVIADKFHSYTDINFGDFQVGHAQKDGASIAFISVEAASVPLVFTRPGTYPLPEGKQATAFGKGTVYFRHGAKSEPVTGSPKVNPV